MASQNEVTNMALFCDFENIALGVADARYEKFDIKRVLEKLLLKGSIVVKKAYCDWERYKAYKKTMHEANFELIEIPHVRISGKNSADIRMVVDALDLCYTKSHVDTFVVISGDSDFSPLVSKLRENAKTVIGVGVKNSTSDLLIANCDEFIYYDDLVREQRKAPARRSAKSAAKPSAEPAEPAAEAAPATKSRKTAAKATKAAKTPAKGRKRGAKQAAEDDAAAPGEAANEPASAPVRSEDDRLAEALELIVHTVDALAAERGGDDKVWGSMVKQAIKRVKPGFNESYYGFRSFNALLEEAASRGLLALERDEKSGGYALRLAG
ncbi:MAG: NYN domain-containing protein [Betaproteobacteria bacterium]|jgi:uncharacterized protein (TIGR00288 family)|nr:NYN domain-containing protein [Betaproteobacteria bacterium]MDH5285191.1 NYN domain-containing protein [Betaproteobacteria bacterium]